jgi:hypothetical protein
MALYVKFFDFSEQLVKGIHDWDAHTFKVYLTNATPDQTADTIKTDLAEITGGGSTGYTAGGETVTISATESAGTTTVTGTQVVWTGGSSGFGPFRYVVLYNDTAASDNLIAYWDYASAISVLVGETFTVKFSNASPGTIFTLA